MPKIRLLLVLALIGGCATFPDLPTVPDAPRCLKFGSVLTTPDGTPLGDTTWVYGSPIAGVECRP